jgi:hypothetical protein
MNTRVWYPRVIFSVKKLLLVGFLPLALPFARNSSFAASSANDCLYQVDLAQFPKYRALWMAKLGPTPFNHARMMVEPAFAPEYSVSVYSRSLSRDQVKYVVTYIAADQNFWQATDIGRQPQRAQSVKTRRIDCEISKQTGDKLKQAWIEMLSGDQQPKPMREEDAGRATDATVAEFSIQLSRAQTLYGEVAVELVEGRKTRALLQVANALIEYCKAKPTDRPAIASQLDRKVTRVLELLKHRRS